eukprot:CAMPEP_0198229584 /NCGR_PEP_ID=MMETSP1445-20131203/114200_1 /TAXON_ID=36898 /ORGANISM="Pyramimonas sp., Strain CCMP2087" /LENGTH=176 /DNA_ID=CAMNT_0043910049 /DNA_START=382 /DNA_END=908 /DNA_ORIENTATION=+
MNCGALWSHGAGGGYGEGHGGDEGGYFPANGAYPPQQHPQQQMNCGALWGHGAGYGGDEDEQELLAQLSGRGGVEGDLRQPVPPDTLHGQGTRKAQERLKIGQHHGQHGQGGRRGHKKARGGHNGQFQRWKRAVVNEIQWHAERNTPTPTPTQSPIPIIPVPIIPVPVPIPITAAP